jgi:hypothetical protein
MRYLVLQALVLVTFAVASAQQNYQDLEAFFKPTTTPQKGISAKTYFLKDTGNCSNTIVLNSDSTFLREIGCDGHSFVTVGKWRKFKDSIELIAFEQKNMSLICSVKSANDEADSTITFYFRDKLGLPIKAFHLIETSRFIRDSIHYSRGNRRIETNLNSDETGKIVINKSDKLDSLNFYKFKVITDKPFTIAFTKLPSKIYIQLNVNGLGLFYTNFKYFYFSQPMVFRRTKNALKTRNNIWRKIKFT